MNKPNADEGMLEFFILSTLSVEPMDSFLIEHSVERRVGRWFEVRPDTVSAALQRMERVAWIDAEFCQMDKLHREKVYSLAVAGKDRLEAERARRTSELAQFVEDGKGFVRVFGKVMSPSWNLKSAMGTDSTRL